MVFEFRVRSVTPVTSHWSMPINVKTLWLDVDSDDEEGAQAPDPFDEPNFHHHEHREQPRQSPDQVW